MHDHNDARVAALQRAVEAERLEDIRRARRFLELATKVRAFRDGKGEAPTEAELNEWAEHTAKAAAVAERLAERLAELHELPEEASPISDFSDSTGMSVTQAPHARRSPQIEWTETFAYAFVELTTDAGGEIADLQQMRALGANLWLEKGGRDAIEVAQEEFDKRTPH